MNKKKKGDQGEKIAANYLSQNGYTIISLNERFGRLGEIDIIACEKEYVCFIEVKTRTSRTFGTPAEAVNSKKQQSIKRMAQIYVSSSRLGNANLRFDIVEVYMSKKNNLYIANRINIIKNAF